MYYGYAAGNLQQQSYRPKKAPWEEEKEAAAKGINTAQHKEKTTSPPKEQKPKKEEEDPFLAGFNKYDNEEKERLKKFAKIRANADKRAWVADNVLEETPKQSDPFLSGFNQTRDEELAEIREKASLFKSKPREPIFTIGQDGDLVSNLPLFGEGEMFELEPINRRDFTSSQKEEKPKEKNIWQKGLDHLSTALTAASFIPGLDTFTNIAQIPVDLLRGDFVGAGLDLVGVIPFVGEGADAAKTARTVDRIVDGARVAEAVDDAVDAAKMTDKISDTVKLTGDVTDTAKIMETAETAENAVDVAEAAVKKATQKTSLILEDLADESIETARRGDKYAEAVESGYSLYGEINKSKYPIEELAKQANSVAYTSPVTIPKSANVTPEIKNGYYQIKYDWADVTDGYTYRSRWHTKTPKAPDYQGDSFVIERKIRGVNYGKNIVKGEHKVLLSDGSWVDFDVWQDAIRAGANRTKEQAELLYKGHLKPIKRGGNR